MCESSPPCFQAEGRAVVAPAYVQERHLRSKAYSAAIEAGAKVLCDQGWRRTAHASAKLSWTVFQGAKTDLPVQGWKLHIALTAAEAEQVLRVLLPELGAYDVVFKLPSTLKDLVGLNTGLFGVTQIGKAITVYPASDAVLVALVERLQKMLSVAARPSVPSDLAVDPARGLWIRFGVFRDAASIADARGMKEPQLHMPNGVPVKDLRDPHGGQPQWAPQPPVRIVDQPDSGVSKPFIVDGRQYIRLKVLANNLGCRTDLGVDLKSVRSVVIKTATPGEGCLVLGDDAVGRLAHEHRMLSAASPVGVVPRVVAYDSGNHILIVEDLGGGLVSRLDNSERVESLPKVAACLADIHDAGLVHRDVKLSNVIRSENGVKLIDFQTAVFAGDPDDGNQLFTPGYRPPTSESARIQPSYDVYGLAGCITQACLETDPGVWPVDDNARRQADILEISGQYAAARLVREVTQGEASRPSARFMATRFEQELENLRSESAACWSGAVTPLAPDVALSLSKEAGLATRDSWLQQPKGHLYRDGYFGSDDPREGINIGAPGIVLGLMTIDEATGSSDFEADALGAAIALADATPAPLSHGLFTGNAGVGLALAVAGRRYGCDDLIKAARQRLEVAASRCAEDPDLFSGRAGIVWATCLVSSVLGERWPLEMSAPLVDSLCMDVVADSNIIGWRSCSAYDPAKSIYFGASHGAAGIALALAEWGNLAKRQRPCELAHRVFASLANNGGAACVKDSALRPPDTEAEPSHAWCHGIVGYLWCLMQAPAEAVPEKAFDWAVDVFHRVKTPLGDTTCCHGLSGVLEVSRMLCSRTDHVGVSARRVGQIQRILATLAVRQNGYTIWGSETSDTVSPDLWVGWLGPATGLAMSAINSPFALLSNQWLGRCAGKREVPIRT